ncbi:Tyrosinase copper-binding domain-containing protein [Madurella fahalii]|uniref:Tyrosinase copper-binding domain-containing protein n=1 Tax=Madurella fahalii TaxID=1157608 RepID=A0ABQ0FZ30_9PEZI
MQIKNWLLATILGAGICEARPARPNCQPLVRKEWRTLTTAEKTAYLNAVQCILSKPARTLHFNNTGVLSRYDDLVYTHIQQTFSMHYTGHFLAWHRYFTATYERMLRDECGYAGAQPYWDWTLDTPAENFASSPVFDPVMGFGGNGAYVEGDPSDPFAVPGRTGGGCVADGPFAGVDDLVHLGPADGVTYNPQCLKRDLSPYFAARYLAMNQTQLTLSQPDFGTFDRVVQGGPSFEMSGVHGGGHYGVGGTFGQMGDLYTSPADPIFYLHHANLGRVWWSWQKMNLPARLTDISGPLFLMDYDNLQGGNVTLATPISVGVSAPDVTVGDLMDIAGCDTDGVLCYEYDTLYTLQP